jgi:hypothetical protein
MKCSSDQKYAVRANLAETLGMMTSDAALAMLNRLKPLSLLVSEALLQTRVADSDVLGRVHANKTKSW